MSALTGPIEQFEATGSHFEVGFAIGKRFAEQIHRLFDNYRFFQHQVLPYHCTPEGRGRYQKLLDLNRARYPGYFAELKGLAMQTGEKRRDPDQALVTIERVYAERIERQDLLLERQAGRWRIVEVRGSTPLHPFFKYGTHVQ